MQDEFDEFKDKKVVITGASGVFGRFIAAAFARAGAKLCLSDMRADGLTDMVDELGLKKGGYLTHETELQDAASANDLVALVERQWGAPDILINNAGVYPSSLLLDTPLEEWDRIFDVNLRAPFILSTGFGALMKKHAVKGNIINISSGASRRVRPTTVPYCTSKAALNHFSKGLALEFSSFGVRVNVVEPGFAPGSIVSELSEEHVARVSANIPLGRTSGPDDVANAIMFLCSSKGQYITGAILSVDGGNSIGN
ncbi:3-oxoacyl-[acyl-carrier protein] reductase [hydrothermal vent metagenome]|uniref:3-oxoacyl-[acyl-carrier protein] reductase n=1 Tax=hydrothermal vent metagenome TaxID=652676 RepID=A0A3B0U558_9ZZZZ